MRRQEYPLRVLEFNFRKRLCKYHLPVEVVIGTVQPADYQWHHTTRLQKNVLEVDFDCSFRMFTMSYRAVSRVKHAFQGKLSPLREGNVEFQPGLCINPKTQYYPFIHYNCYRMLYLLDTIRTKTILVQCFPDCCHSRHIDGGRQPTRILFRYSNEFSLSLHSKFYSWCDPNACHPVVFTTKKSAVSAKYSLNLRYIH